MRGTEMTGEQGPNGNGDREAGGICVEIGGWRAVWIAQWMIGRRYGERQCAGGGVIGFNEQWMGNAGELIRDGTEWWREMIR